MGFFLFALAGFGLLFGSFANVVIWRLPRRESLAAPASHCPKCETPIAWYDNIPVISWLVLRGRCRSCGCVIPARYPAVELLCGVLWLGAGMRFGMTLNALFAAVLFLGLLVLAFIDLDHQRLPNVLVGALGLLGAFGVGLGLFVDPLDVPLVGIAAQGWFSRPWAAAALGLLLGGGTSLLISLLYHAMRGKSGLGMGDVKLLGVLGIFTGPLVLMVLMLGSIMGTVYGVAYMRRGGVSATTRVPFGPFLAAGAVIVVLFGPQLWMAYAHAVGFA